MTEKRRTTYEDQAQKLLDLCRLDNCDHPIGLYRHQRRWIGEVLRERDEALAKVERLRARIKRLRRCVDAWVQDSPDERAAALQGLLDEALAEAEPLQELQNLLRALRVYLAASR